MTRPLPPLPSVHFPYLTKSANDRDTDDEDLSFPNVSTVQAVPSLWGFPLKYISCVLFHHILDRK